MIRITVVTTGLNPETKRQETVTTHRFERWGTLAGLQALDSKPLGKVGNRLNEALIALRDAIASEDQPRKSLGRWVFALEYVKKAEKQLADYESGLAAFCRPDNLKLLRLLVGDRFQQRSAVRAALEVISRKRITDADVSAAQDAWDAEIRNAHNGRQFSAVA